MPNIRQLMMGAAGVSTGRDDPEGKMFAWGDNNDGMLGDGSTSDRNSPVQIGSLTTWAQVGAWDYSSAAIKTDGTLWTWGSGSNGALGDGTTTNRSSPAQVGSLTDWFMVMGGQAQVAIKTDGTIWSWGYNGDGQLGDGSKTSRCSPAQIGSGTDWKAMTSDERDLGHPLKFAKHNGDVFHVIKANGELWGWGPERHSGGWEGGTAGRCSPVQVGDQTNWASIAAWAGNAIGGVKTDGTLWTWGQDRSYGTLGRGTTNVTEESAAQVGSRTDWKMCSGGSENFMLAVTTEGSGTGGALYAWGNNGDAMLGTGNKTNYSAPQQVGTDTDWDIVMGGKTDSRASRTDGTFWAWGQNNKGQLGDGSTTDRSSPVQIGSETTWRQFISGEGMTLAIR